MLFLLHMLINLGAANWWQSPAFSEDLEYIGATVFSPAPHMLAVSLRGIMFLMTGCTI